MYVCWVLCLSGGSFRWHCIHLPIHTSMIHPLASINSIQLKKSHHHPSITYQPSILNQFIHPYIHTSINHQCNNHPPILSLSLSIHFNNRKPRISLSLCVVFGGGGGKPGPMQTAAGSKDDGTQLYETATPSMQTNTSQLLVTTKTHVTR